MPCKHFLQATLALCLLACTWGKPLGAEERTIGSSPVDVAVQPDLVHGPELQAYVDRVDASYRWEVREDTQISGCEIVRLHLVSQSWQGNDWRHVLYLIKPLQLDTRRRDAVLLIGGGRWQAEWPESGPESLEVRREASLLATVANHFGCIIAVLNQVPFQPLLGDKYEDEIIATTFANYIQTQDASWPLLLPMVKSAVRAMDATTEAARQRWGIDLDQFTVTGASKRGWTTWLTGAVDPRATTICPMVIDMLNMQQQMQHQLASWGAYSEQIADYTELNLPELLGTPRGSKLQCIVDPFAYRQSLRQPKLLIFGTNDRYWPLDACNLYWEQLQGDKYLLYVPNQGHSINDYARVLGSIAAVHRGQHAGRSLPKLNWVFEQSDTAMQLQVRASGDIDSVQGWVAHAPTRDFREAQWHSKACTRGADSQWTLDVPRPSSGFVACFVEVVCVDESLPASFSTNVEIASSIQL